MNASGSSPPPSLVSFCEVEYPRLVGALTLYCGGRAIAEEIAQEALIKVCRHWSRVARLDNPGAWANRIAINLANSHFRRLAAERRARARIGALVEEQPDATVALEIRDLVTALPARQRKALILRHYLGFSVAETADAMGCPEGTVKRLTHDAVVSLRRGAAVDGIREVTDAT